MGWVAIFAIVLFLYSQRDRLGEFTRETGSKLPILTDQRTEGQTLRIAMARDGHFWAEGKINGTSAHFLIDSGATITALSQSVAQRAGLAIDMDGPGVMMKTANGSIVARRSSVAGLTVGPIQTNDLPVVVSDSFEGINVLGMNFLSRLKSWRVERNEMVLEP
ncbi:MAG: hypothetical protein B7Z20_12360 [Sphingobium sp. 32-64-5]|nr:MAG: hypothetical protein B7Z20_12360 [Sphingobium sp. 32-64-5]